LALAAVTQSDDKILGEAADLLFHMLLLLKAKGLTLAQVADTLQSRHKG
jgi:phosphoribosyl-ATP pyrophosphohydrolase/phosphoribosyl-AMP cyclohydrolase